MNNEEIMKLPKIDSFSSNSDTKKEIKEIDNFQWSKKTDNILKTKGIYRSVKPLLNFSS